MFKVGTKVIWFDDGKIHDGVIASVRNTNEVVLVGERYPRYSAFLYPDTLECQQFLLDGIALLEKQKKESDEYMVATYKLNNELVRRGLK